MAQVRHPHHREEVDRIRNLPLFFLVEAAVGQDHLRPVEPLELLVVLEGGQNKIMQVVQQGIHHSEVHLKVMLEERPLLLILLVEEGVAAARVEMG